MIFTPCKDGLSHNEAESIKPEEAEVGAQVLFEAGPGEGEPGAGLGPVACSGSECSGPFGTSFT